MMIKKTCRFDQGSKSKKKICEGVQNLAYPHAHIKHEEDMRVRRDEVLKVKNVKMGR